ncbi:MAG: peptidase sortase [Ilumatobacteraceae bacterium]|nr:peptidase sortase [Ilumatobacteraceae bacterium]
MAAGLTWGMQQFFGWLGGFPRDASEDVAATPEPVPAPASVLERSDPTRIVIPEIEVDAPMVPLALDGDGRLEAPRGTSEVGWFRDGPEPGEVGAAVVAGHLDSRDGGAVFARLSEVRPGTRVEFSSASGITAFEVTRVEQYPKSEIPNEIVYGHPDRPELRLITCGGTFDEGIRHYRDNLVVYATLIGPT